MDTQSWLKRLRIEIELKRYSTDTLECYTIFVSKFLKYFVAKDHPTKVNIDEIKQYLLTFKLHPAQYKQSLASLRFFYRFVIHQPEKFKDLQYPKWESKLPTIIDKTTLLKRIAAIRNKRDKAFFALLYGTGMRVGEACKIRIADIDGTRKTITIRRGKGDKDRVVPIPDVLLTLLRNHFIANRPKDWLFQGTNPENYVSKTLFQKLCHQYIGINCHGLRHCYAVHQLEAGVSIYVIKELFGHKDIRTTEKYLRSMNPSFNIPQNPLNDLETTLRPGAVILPIKGGSMNEEERNQYPAWCPNCGETRPGYYPFELTTTTIGCKSCQEVWTIKDLASKRTHTDPRLSAA